MQGQNHELRDDDVQADELRPRAMWWLATGVVMLVCAGVLGLATGSVSSGSTVRMRLVPPADEFAAPTDELVPPTTEPAVTLPPPVITVLRPAVPPTAAPVTEPPTTVAPPPPTAPATTGPPATTPPPERSVRIARTQTFPGYVEYTLRGTGCITEGVPGVAAFRLVADGQEVDGNGAPASPDGSWELAVRVYPGMPAPHLATAACYEDGSRLPYFSYAPLALSLLTRTG